MSTPEYALVVPTVGRACLGEALRAALAAPAEVAPAEIVVVDDRVNGEAEGPLPGVDHSTVRVLRTGGGGPATARQAGWHSCTAPWVVFLDDDVRPPVDWPARLCADLVDLPADVAGVQGRVTVPRPQDRRPTDAERNTIALESAHWITADLAVRRSALEDVGGFDTRFPRAYREDTDLVLRLWDAGFSLRRGRRECVHPLRDGGRRASLAAQRGNADNALMRRLHGPRWRERVGEEPGGLRSHLVTTALLVAGVGAALSGYRRLAAVLGVAWTGRTARFTLGRVSAGPNDPAEWWDMALTSALIPPLAFWHRAAGELRHTGASRRPAVRAVLFDRDGTLVEDVPYNSDPDKVIPRPGAAEAVALAREHGLAVGVVTNQSGIARGFLTERELAAVNDRVEGLLGPFDLWQVCPHVQEDGCSCRKPRPGMLLGAAEALGVHPAECAMVGDIGADMEAASTAGARGVLVPTPLTRPEECLRAPEVENDPLAAVATLVGKGTS